MREKLKTVAEIFLGRGRFDIRKKLLRLVLFGSVLTFSALSLISLIGMFTTWHFLEVEGEELGGSVADYTKNFIEERAKSNLLESTQLRAKMMNCEFQNIIETIQVMSDTLSNIMRSPENHTPRRLPNALYETVYSATPYIHYSKELLEKGLTDEIIREVEITSNFADLSQPLSKFYTCVIIGSRKGYTVTLDVMPEDDPVVPLSNEPARTEYDPRTKRWYKIGETVTKPTFTDIYLATGTNEPCISCVMPYYDNDGFAGVTAIDRRISDIYQLIGETKLSDTGFCFIINENGDVLYSTQEEGIFKAGEKNLRNSSDIAVENIARRMINGENSVMMTRLDNKDYFIAFAPMDSVGWSIASVVEKDEVFAPAEIARENVLLRIENFKTNFGQLFVLLLILGIILLPILLSLLFRMGIKISARFVEPIQELSDGVREIASGNLDKKLDIKTGDEIEHLATCFNAMTDELQTYMANLTKVTAEKERIATELDVAKDIQTSMLPNIFPPFPERKEFDIYATMNAAKEVGGDFYDFYLLDENHLVITIADVSGKGIPAALFMMISKTILKNFSMTMTNPEDFSAVMTLANNQLCQNNDAMMFVTVFMGMLDLKTGEFVYVNGGHNPPLLYKKSADEYNYLEVKRNFVLGGMDDLDFVQQKIKLEQGDKIFLYTDGVTEALNKKNDQYGEKNLRDCLNRSEKNLSVEELLRYVRADVNKHVDGAEQSDDITMLVLKFNG